MLVLLGFAATDFVITMTLSAADAAAHVDREPLRARASCTARSSGSPSACSPCSARCSCAGFTEAIGLAVGLVGVYLVLNAVVLVVALVAGRRHPTRGDRLELRADHRPRQPGDDGRGRPDGLPPARARPLRLRDRRRGDAARARGSRRRRGPPGRARPRHQEAAHLGGGPDERLPGGQLLRDHAADPRSRLRARGSGQRPGARLPGPRVPRQRLRHGVRRLDDRDPVVRRRLRDGRPAEPDPALPAALRDGAGVGGRRTPAGARADRDRLPDHLDLRRQRRRAGRRLRHRRAGPDHQRGRRGDPGGTAGRAAQADGRVRRWSPRSSSTRPSTTSSSVPTA